MGALKVASEPIPSTYTPGAKVDTAGPEPASVLTMPSGLIRRILLLWESVQ